MKTRTAALALVLGASVTARAAPRPKNGPMPVSPDSLPSSQLVNPAADAPGKALSAEQLKQIDQTLREAENIVLDLESMTQGGGDGSGCPAGFSVREYMQDIRAKRLSKEAGDDLLDSSDGLKEDSGPKLDWQFYYLCEAMASHNPAACAEAASVTPKTLNRTVSYKEGLQDPNAISEDRALALEASQSYEGKCTISYYQESARAAFISRSPQFMDICKTAVPHLTEVKDAAAAEGLCRAWRDYNGDPNPFLAAIQASVVHPLKREFAAGIVKEMTVAPGTCSSLDREYYRRLCREQEDYRKALRAKDPAACRGGLCRMLMGGGAAACESYAKRFKAAACTQRYDADFLASREKDFKRYADQVEKALGGSDAGVGGDTKQLKEMNARLDKLYDLRQRFDAASDSISPKKKSAPTKRG